MIFFNLFYKDDTGDELFADSERNYSNIDASSASQVYSETTTATRSTSIFSDAFSETENNASVIPQPSSSPSICLYVIKALYYDLPIETFKFHATAKTVITCNLIVTINSYS